MKKFLLLVVVAVATFGSIIFSQNTVFAGSDCGGVGTRLDRAEIRNVSGNNLLGTVDLCKDKYNSKFAFVTATSSYNIAAYTEYTSNQMALISFVNGKTVSSITGNSGNARACGVITNGPIPVDVQNKSVVGVGSPSVWGHYCTKFVK